MADYIFPKVDLPKVGRSNHSLSRDDFFSFAPGTIRVAWCKDVLPKDHFEVKLSAGIESMPMLSPLYGKWKATWAFYFEPYTNIYGWMDNNTRRSTESILKSNLMTYMLPPMFTSQALPMDMEEGTVAGEFPDSFTYSRAEIPEGLEQTGVPLSEYLSLGKIAPSSIFEDLGWPQGYNGYWSVEELSNVVDSASVQRSQFTEREWIDLNYDEDNKTRVPIPGSLHCSFQKLHIAKALGYLDIIRNYYVNNQASVAPYVTYSDADGQQDDVSVVSLETLDFIFRAVRALPTHKYNDVTCISDIVRLFEVGSAASNPIDAVQKQVALAFLQRWEQSYVVPNGGCFLATHAMDLNRGLMSVENGNFKSYVQADASGRISMDSLYMQNSVQQLINVLDITNGRFADWVNALWAVDIKGDIDRPVYLGSHTEIINTTDIVAPVSTDQSQAGQQTGFSAGGFGNKQFRKVSFNSDQYGTIYCIFSMVPVVMYSTGFQREDLKSTFAGIYNPRMANLGYQDVPAKVLNGVTPLVDWQIGTSANSRFGSTWLTDDNVLTTDDIAFRTIKGLTPDNISRVPLRYPNLELDEDWQDEVVGRQVAWAEYMADVNRSRGFFAKDGSLSYWTLNRSFTLDSLIEQAVWYNVSLADMEGTVEYSLLGVRSVGEEPSYTTYVLPSKWNDIFAQTDSYAQNFRQYLKLDVFAKRAIPKRQFPHM